MQVQGLCWWQGERQQGRMKQNCSLTSCLPAQVLESHAAHCRPRMRETQSPCTGSWSLAPALCLSPQRQQWLCSLLDRPTTSLSLPGFSFNPTGGQAGITPDQQETQHSAWLIVRPPMGAVPDTLRKHTHACLLLQGSQLRTLCGTEAGGLR